MGTKLFVKGGPFESKIAHFSLFESDELFFYYLMTGGGKNIKIISSGISLKQSLSTCANLSQITTDSPFKATAQIQGTIKNEVLVTG